MENYEHLPTISKSICDYLELLFAPEFYRGFNPKNYPPYNIVQLSSITPQVCGEVLYRIDIAVAGFNSNDITIELNSDNSLVISAAKIKRENTVYVHRGISGRSFQLKFKLSLDVVVVVDDVVLENGILSIPMKRKDSVVSGVKVKTKSKSNKVGLGCRTTLL